MSDKYQEVTIYLFGISGNKIRPEPVGVAVFHAGELTPENLVVVASSYDWRDGNQNGEVSLLEKIYAPSWFGKNILMEQVASQLMVQTANPAWSSIRNEVFFETTANIVSDLAEQFLTDAIVGPISGAIGKEIADALAQDRVLQIIIADRASTLIQDYISNQLDFGQRPDFTGIKPVYIDNSSGYLSTETVDHLISIASPGEPVNVSSGSDVVFGSSGEDLVYGGAGRDSVFGGGGIDTIYGGPGNDDLRGENGTDLLLGEGENDALYGGTGNDSLYGGAGDDQLFGEEDADLLKGESGNDTLYGGSGNDQLFGDEGIDTLKGEIGNDELWGGDGNDVLYGDENDDHLIGQAGNDTLDGGTGYDTAIFSLGFSSYTFTSLGGGSYSVRALSGSEGTDTLIRTESITFGTESRTASEWLSRAGGVPTPAPSPIDSTPFTPAPPTTPPTGVSNSLLSVSAVNQTLAVGQSVSLSQIFPKSSWHDTDGAYDIQWVSLQDRTADGGHLTFKGGAVAPNIVYEIAVADLANWRFVAANGVAVDEIGFNVIQADGDFSPRLTPGAVVTTVVPANSLPPSPAPVTLPDLDVARLDLDLREGSSAEEGDNASFTIQRRGSQEGDIVVKWQIAGIGDSPADRRDFPAMSGIVTLYDDRGDRNFSIGVHDDNIDELDKKFRIDLTVVSGNAVVDDDDATFTIIDNDAPLGIDLTVDDHGNSFTLATNVAEDQWARGFIEQPGDQDFFRFDLLGGTGYEFILIKDNDLSLIDGDSTANYPTLPQPITELYNATGQLLATLPATSLSNRWAHRFETPADGSYYLRVRDNGNNDIGQYFVQADIRVKADDFTGNTSTLGRQDIGGVSVGHHERSTDDDWFRVDLDAGKSYRFVLFSDEREFLANPDGGNGLYYFGWDNASFSIRDGSGAIVQKRVETWPASDNLIEFAPQNSGTYFVSVATSSISQQIYDYRVLAFEVQPRPASPALVIQPDATQVTDVRFASLASTAVNDEILTVNNGHSSAIRFDLSELTAQASYAAIEVFLFATSSATGNVGDIVVDVPGSSLGNTSTFGAIGSIEFLTAIPNPVVGSWVTIEITNLYNRWISGETPNNGIILSTSEFGSTPVMSFYSSNYAVDPSLRPRLILDGPDIISTVIGESTASISEDDGYVLGSIGLTGTELGFENAASTGNWGSIIVDETGTTWTYTLGANAQALKQGQVVEDVVKVTAASGISQNIRLIITGQNDPAIVIGAGVQEMNESALQLKGASTLFDIDAALQPSFVPSSLLGAFGQFTISAAGDWTYVLSTAGMLALGTGETKTELFSILTTDSTSVSYSINIVGTDNDKIDLTSLITNQSVEGGKGNDILDGGSGNDSLYGGDGNDSLTGGFGNDLIDGGAGSDTLIGWSGIDTMIGGLGNDIYFVENTGDIVTENLNQGTDTVSSRLTYTLPINVENLTLTGTSAINGTGNDLNNVITGNSAANQLNGQAGNDTLNGGGGDDILTGWSGVDIMIGGLGNDTYFVENAGDVVTENLNQGVDTVSSRLTYTLPANVENLILTGTATVNGTGNGLANGMTGNSAANQLNGGAGNDTLDGGTGTNSLTGGAGNDIFRFTTKGHIDAITDFSVVNDTIQLENAVFTALTTVGTLAASQFKIGAQALDADDFVIYNNVTGALLYDANGSGAGAAVQIATLGVGLTMTNADIVVI